MRKYLSILALIGISLGSIYGLSQTSAQAAEVTLYKNPQCLYCEGYAEYLRDNGHTVTDKPTHGLVSMSRTPAYRTTSRAATWPLIDDYVVSGHVPVDTIDRLLSEQPDIKGVTLPGMPAGSPGMTGTKTGGPLKIHEVNL